MSEQDIKQAMRITKNTSISIGLGVVIVGAMFWAGMALGAAQERQDTHELLNMHKGGKEVLDDYMPRREIQTNFINIGDRLDDIQETQKQILFKLNEK